MDTERTAADRLLVDLTQVRALVVEAELVEAAGHRYVAAHQAAVRAADLVLRARTGRGVAPGVIDPWVLVARYAPELGEWASFFAATSVRRRLIGQGRAHATTREADDLVRDAERFCTEVERWLRRSGRRPRWLHAVEDDTA
ncbi:SAV_6107 family HEPN domain-containing protein [Aestuariimicrobium ganziense]|uniref:SAV_6107 family HEPN domain-containing protein n=1 Tax=Aestuariimicrobium ganziense TaxID=2773677 RepID=UPI0019410D88|nr:SAV_6107 family HEPN domain-containing protein [Aestuariimicrobium ganziense]